MQNETIIELNMIRMEPYIEIISTVEPTCGCCLILERMENEGLIRIQLSSRCQVIYLTNLYAQSIPQEVRTEVEMTLQEVYEICEEPMEITETLERIVEESEENEDKKEEKKEITELTGEEKNLYQEFFEFLDDEAKEFFSTN